jgi:hypothetical protein
MGLLLYPGRGLQSSSIAVKDDVFDHFMSARESAKGPNRKALKARRNSLFVPI